MRFGFDRNPRDARMCATVQKRLEDRQNRRSIMPYPIRGLYPQPVVPLLAFSDEGVPGRFANRRIASAHAGKAARVERA